MDSLCTTCANCYLEYGCYLCKYEGDEDISPAYYEDKPVTECSRYSEEIDYPTNEED